MSARILVDTNVWIDSFDGGRATSPSSRAVLDLAKRGSVDLLFSVSSAKDVYYLVASSLKRKARQALGHLSQRDAEASRSIASACMSAMVASATPVALDVSDVWMAEKLQRVHPDFEDCLIMAAAKRAKADYIVTNDEDFRHHSVVPALTPSEALALLA